MLLYLEGKNALSFFSSLHHGAYDCMVKQHRLNNALIHGDSWAMRPKNDKRSLSSSYLSFFSPQPLILLDTSYTDLDTTSPFSHQHRKWRGNPQLSASSLRPPFPSRPESGCLVLDEKYKWFFPKLIIITIIFNFNFLHFNTSICTFCPNGLVMFLLQF